MTKLHHCLQMQCQFLYHVLQAFYFTGYTVSQSVSRSFQSLSLTSTAITRPSWEMTEMRTEPVNEVTLQSENALHMTYFPALNNFCFFYLWTVA